VPASANGDRAATIRSAVCIAGPPPFTTDDGGGTLEWFVPLLGRGARRAVRAGDHLAPGHALVLTYPGHFTESAEPPDCWPVGQPDADTRQQRQAEQLRLASHPARHVRPCCARCGAEHDQSVVMLQAPGQLDLINALSTLDDGDTESRSQRWRIEQEFASMARAAHDQTIELQRLEAEFRASHPRCPEGTAPMPRPDAPSFAPLFYRSPGVR
jgi:hypothetical protein